MFTYNLFWIFRVERECNKDVTYNGIHIKKGTVVSVPIFALHYDADYYPDPETFNPDRHEKCQLSLTQNFYYLSF